MNEGPIQSLVKTLENMMNVINWITSLPPWALFLLTTIIGILAAELGIRLAQRKRQKEEGGEVASAGSLVGALLGLLAFMLGFTFAITASRFSDRKALVVEQAKAIGTCYLRTSFLPENQKQESRKLLREYADILVQMKYSNLDKAIARMEALHLLIWNQTASLAQEKMDSELRAQYVSSVNEVIDIFGERKTVSLVYRIPAALWTALFLLFILSMFIVGNEIGSISRRRKLDTPIMAAAFALVVMLIADMDSIKGARRFRVSWQPLIETRQSMNDSIP
jgi:hypothetical protein